ncbi:hypothetical protein [Deinococcus daejeonensis]|uniref:hypothetical protein n=1 Tax=Deinococcus daejeonensis TaxID=1007098 RepID=UPI0016657BE3|nr:hypothetical protein [Deinococcus daejeonensis]
MTENGPTPCKSGSNADQAREKQENREAIAGEILARTVGVLQFFHRRKCRKTPLYRVRGYVVYEEKKDRKNLLTANIVYGRRAGFTLLKPHACQG